jgi:hypothetical protein
MYSYEQTEEEERLVDVGEATHLAPLLENPLA